MANYSNEYATSGNTHQHKIKRTVEHILTWVGVVLQALVAILFLLAKPFLGNDSFKDQMVKEAQKQGEQISTSDINQGFDALSGVINFFTWGAIIPLILAIIGGLLISKAPKIAGILILIAGFIALASNWISVVLWIVAGIMLLVRKGKKKDYDNRYYANDSKYDDHNRAYDDRHDNNFDNRHNNDHNNRYDNDYDNRRHNNGGHDYNDRYDDRHQDDRRNVDNHDRHVERENINNGYRDSNHRDDLHRSNDNDFQRENNTDWTSEKDRHDVSDDHDHRDNNDLGRNLANNEERHFNDADRSQGYDEDNHFRRSDRYNEDNHEFGNTNNEHQDHHRDNDFLQDETQKLKDKKDNDPYKY